MDRPVNSAKRSIHSIGPATHETAPPVTRQTVPDGSAEKALSIDLPAPIDSAGPPTPLGIARLPAEFMVFNGMLDLPDILTMRSVNKGIQKALETAVDNEQLRQVFVDQTLEREGSLDVPYGRIKANMDRVLIQRKVQRLAHTDAEIKRALALKPHDYGVLYQVVERSDVRQQYAQAALALKLIIRYCPLSPWQTVAHSEQLLTRLMLAGQADRALAHCDRMLAQDQEMQAPAQDQEMQAPAQDQEMQAPAQDQEMRAAIAEWVREADIDSIDGYLQNYRVAAFLLMGRPGEALGALQVCERPWPLLRLLAHEAASQHRDVLPLDWTPTDSDRAIVLFSRGQTEAGLRSVEMLDQFSPMLDCFVRQLPSCELIRNDPRWRLYEDRTGLSREFAEAPVDFGLRLPDDDDGERSATLIEHDDDPGSSDWDMPSEVGYGPHWEGDDGRLGARLRPPRHNFGVEDLDRYARPSARPVDDPEERPPESSEDPREIYSHPPSATASESEIPERVVVEDLDDYARPFDESEEWPPGSSDDPR